jgi:hypothetical protein
MDLATSGANRDVGVVYSDPKLQASPATHALVLGVGQYASNRSSLVRSSTIAARMIAEWFLEGTLGQKSGFENPAKPLGSLGVLLSELPSRLLSHVADAPVPRATHRAHSPLYFNTSQQQASVWNRKDLQDKYKFTYVMPAK